MIGWPVLQILEHNNVINIKKDNYCFNFHLSLFIDEIGQSHLFDESSNELIRVDWQGKEQGTNTFDPSKRVFAFLEFEKSMSHHLPHIKSSYQSPLELVAIDHNMNRLPGVKPIPAAHIIVKHDSDDTLVVSWSPHTLEKNVCYKLMFNSNTGRGPDTGLSSMLRPEIADAEDMHVCMAGGDCDAIGTSEIFQNEDGSSVCICHPFFGGIDCSQCIEGYYRNKDGFCEKASLCVDEGGEEDCNGHGVCYQEGPSAVCICDHGFTHDGLDQCARC